MVAEVRIMGIAGMAEVEEGADLASMIVDAARNQGTALEANDVVVVTQKVVSKAEGAIVDLRDVKPSALAEELAREHDKDPRHVEVVLRETRRVVRMDRGVLIVETKHGLVCANAGVDASNIPGEEKVSLLPRNPDESARGLRGCMMALTGIPLAVIVTDTFGRPWRLGTTDVAIGVAGIAPLRDYRGEVDPYGYLLHGSVAAIADEIASAADLVGGKVEMMPVTIVRGMAYTPDEEASGRLLQREASQDLFR